MRLPDPASPAGAPPLPRATAVVARLPALTSSRLAGAAHVASLAGTVAFWAWLDRGLWFFGDEWDFLVDRGLGYSPASPHSIWFPHNEHWSTLPVLAWRALYSIWHLSSYWPYLGLLFAVQVAVVHLAWRACRRVGASPWVSTAAAAMLGLLGAGGEDFVWAFQVGFVGSVAFGLVAFDLLDRPRQERGRGPSPRRERRQGPSPQSAPARRPALALAGLAGVLPAGRDLAGSAALLASLMCSTIGDAMVVGAAVLAFGRLGWRRAAKVLWLPVTCYVVWFAGVGRLGLSAHSDHFGLATFTALPGFVWAGLSSALGQVFGLEALGAALLVGLAAWVASQSRRLWNEQPALLGLCAAALAFYLLAGVGRDVAGKGPGASRYVYVAFAMLVPVIARLLSGRREQSLAQLLAVGLVLFSTLGNIGQARTWASSRRALTTKLKTQLLATGELVAAGVPDVSGPGAAPVPGDPNLQVANIAQLERAHLLGHPRLGATTLADARAVLALGVWNGLEMTLSHKAIFAGRFELTGVSLGSQGRSGRGCTDFQPVVAAPAMQVRLSLLGKESSASVEISVGSGQEHVGAILAPPGGPASAPVELAVPPNGTGWLDDDAPGAAVVVTWSGPGPLVLCALAGRADR